MNLSNVPPPESGKAKDIEIVVKEPKRTSIESHVATPTEQALLRRVESLERQLRERQYAAQAPALPPQMPYGGYYPPALPPPPTPYYDSGYDDSSYYRSNYPS